MSDTYTSYDLVEFGKPLQARQRPMPKPQGTEVLLRIRRSGVCHSDIHIQDGYFDLGSFGNFQPYVGGGIGIARVRWRDETGAITCVPVHADVATETCVAKGTTDQPVPNEPVSFQGTKATGIDYQFAYSAMAGFGYRLTDNITLDANYRFLSTGADAINYSNGSHIGDGGFGVHQVRAGLRWELW